jgi:CxxC motif-containing protein (DUF1111 family)
LDVRATRIIPLIVIALLCAVAWLEDFVTLQGERTVYTAKCEGDAWRGKTCTGKLESGARYRFRALKAHKEVLFWTAGETGASGKLIDCEVESGRHWRCKPLATPVNTITFEMVQGKPARNPTWKVIEAHPISKAQWYLLHLGIPTGSDADG